MSTDITALNTIINLAHLPTSQETSVSRRKYRYTQDELQDPLLQKVVFLFSPREETLSVRWRQVPEFQFAHIKMGNIYTNDSPPQE